MFQLKRKESELYMITVSCFGIHGASETQTGFCGAVDNATCHVNDSDQETGAFLQRKKFEFHCLARFNFAFVDSKDGKEMKMKKQD
jgi:hypothetical protein